MALTDEHLRALAELPASDSGITFDPTLLPESYLPQLLALRDAHEADVALVAKARGWSEVEAGRLIGAIDLARSLEMCGLLPPITQ